MFDCWANSPTVGRGPKRHEATMTAWGVAVTRPCGAAQPPRGLIGRRASRHLRLFYRRSTVKITREEQSSNRQLLLLRLILGCGATLHSSSLVIDCSTRKEPQSNPSLMVP